MNARSRAPMPAPSRPGSRRATGAASAAARARRRWLLPIGFAATLITGVTAAPADDPEVPERYVKVDVVKARLDQKMPVVFVDVRPKPQYDATHIRGARSIPLPELPRRLAEVPRKSFLVLY